MCQSNKRRYPNEGYAFNALRKIRKKKPWRSEATAYPCGDCAGWHLTSQLRSPADGVSKPYAINNLVDNGQGTG